MRNLIALIMLVGTMKAYAAGGDYPFFCQVYNDSKVSSFSVTPDMGSPTGYWLSYYTRDQTSEYFPVSLESRCEACEYLQITGSRGGGGIFGMRQEHVNATVPMEDGYSATFTYTARGIFGGTVRRRASCFAMDTDH